MKKVEIFVEPNPKNPREDDHFGYIAYTRSDGEFFTEYSLNSRKPLDFQMWLKDMLGQKRKTAKMLTELQRTFNKQYVGVPIYRVEIPSLNGPLLSSEQPNFPDFEGEFAGYIFTTKEIVRQTFKTKKVTQKIMKETKAILKNELSLFNSYINKFVYGYRIIDEEGNIVQENTNFFGNDWESNGLMDEIPEDFHYQLENIIFSEK